MTIERAARAIRDHIENGQIANPFNFDISRAAFYHDLAIISLRALEEPTPEMINRGKTVHPHIGHNEIQTLWRAMHAAMMKETK